MPVSEKTFRKLALEDPNQWELHYGNLERKPGLTADHNEIAVYLGGQLIQQLDRKVYRVRTSMGQVRRTSENYYIPDVYVVPTELMLAQRGTRRLEVYEAPLPLVVEVWSPSTGLYDVDSKLPEYQRRGDLEIWRIHPYERTLTAWRRQPDGSYGEETRDARGTIQPIALPDVRIDLDVLFD